MTDQNLNQPVVSSEHSDDVVAKTRTIYDVSPFEIFWRNLLAGFARGLGSVVVYFILAFVVGIIFTQVVLPKLQPLIDSYTNSMNTLNSLQKFQFRY